MNLQGIVSVLVAILRVHAFGQRCERIGQFGKGFLFLAFLGRKFAFAGNVVECLVNVDVAGALVKQGTAGIELGLHKGEHVVNGREIDDGLAKLLTVASVGQTFVVGSLRNTDALCGNTQTGTVHQGHHVFNQAQLAFATNFGLGIFVNELTGGAAVNTEFIFDTAHIHTAAALVIDKHRQAATIGSTFF